MPKIQTTQLAEIGQQGPAGHPHHSQKGEAKAVKVGRVGVELEVVVDPRCVIQIYLLGWADSAEEIDNSCCPSR